MNALRARRLAQGSKRLDICAAQIASVLHLAGATRRNLVRGKTCAELGSGWVLSHSLILHLLGARRVVAFDLSPVARVGVLRRAVRTAESSLIRDLLAPFDDHVSIRRRLDRIESMDRFSFETLRCLGIDYVAPFDLAATEPAEEIDFWYSHSVLEHVASDQVRPLVGHMVGSLAPGGAMIHSIHLEDHLDNRSAPFAFLAEPAARYPGSEQVSRGNRIRRDEWLGIFASLPGFEVRPLHSWTRPPDILPRDIDPSVTYVDNADAATSHLGIFGEKGSSALALG